MSNDNENFAMDAFGLVYCDLCGHSWETWYGEYQKTINCPNCTLTVNFTTEEEFEDMDDGGAFA